jgi:hypothetical protein
VRVHPRLAQRRLAHPPEHNPPPRTRSSGPPAKRGDPRPVAHVEALLSAAGWPAGAFRRLRFCLGRSFYGRCRAASESSSPFQRAYQTRLQPPEPTPPALAAPSARSASPPSQPASSKPPPPANSARNASDGSPSPHQAKPQNHRRRGPRHLPIPPNSRPPSSTAREFTLQKKRNKPNFVQPRWNRQHGSRPRAPPPAFFRRPNPLRRARPSPFRPIPAKPSGPCSSAVSATASRPSTRA